MDVIKLYYLRPFYFINFNFYIFLLFGIFDNTKRIKLYIYKIIINYKKNFFSFLTWLK